MLQILVGSSMGGWLMLLAAIARPEKTKALVGISTAADHFVTAFKSLPLQVRDVFASSFQERKTLFLILASYHYLCKES